jgi:hypothetical protein
MSSEFEDKPLDLEVKREKVQKEIYAIIGETAPEQPPSQ